LAAPIISVSGLRGIVGESLTPVVAAEFVAAYAMTRPEGLLLVTRDSRCSGQMLSQAVSASLTAVGHDVLEAGIAATPTTGVLIREFQAVGGVQISASHNPIEYNGLKLFDAEGKVLAANVGEEVLHAYRQQKADWSRVDTLGQLNHCEDVTSTHLESVLKTVSVERIRAAHFKVLLDANHGAGGLLGRRLLEALNCEVIVLGEEADGQFTHPPEPTAENLQQVCTSVRQQGPVIGFCQDPDADRLAVIDETGRYVGEEYTLALCLGHVLSQSVGDVVINCATSMMNQRIAENYGATLWRTSVGEANVVGKMQEVNAIFGGEGNGGPIDPRVGYVRDSFVGMAQILDLMAEHQLPVSQLADQLPKFEMLKEKVDLHGRHVAVALDSLESRFADAQADRTDGLRLTWPDRWLLVRASNTEPIVRLMAESEHPGGARNLCNQARQAIG